MRADTTGNGVTGFVAATGKSYLCEDTSEDPLYLEGAAGARSSLTVPVMLHDRVTGTLNVESPEPRAFSESDLQFLEIFARDVAMALNTLELLAAEKASTAGQRRGHSQRSPCRSTIFHHQGDRLMRVRVREIAATAELAQIDSAGTLVNAAGRTALKPLATAKDLVTAPGKTIGDTFKGVGNLFGSVDASMAATDPTRRS